ncbi:hypothetical protein D3C80_1548340 [compost metagenome]
MVCSAKLLITSIMPVTLVLDWVSKLTWAWVVWISCARLRMLATLAPITLAPVRAELQAVCVEVPTSEVCRAISLTVAEICCEAEAACSVCISTWLLLSAMRVMASHRYACNWVSC